ncbi:phosphoribosyl-ATP diphosphatase [Oceanibacterium hippocampi]|uniref:Phosphoribosyl-ATP pyrophosphatase n=1 Tax=Oceanibacterium hippocampi TaxID=745714 RepID=A0A1Y5RMP0_9PROT|nr:Phosphoribosyl-ATP pyrophosphatase [Oceanibacterium hippocampi]
MTAAVLDRLYAVIESRKAAAAETSYTAKLFARGEGKIAQKLGEEAVETVIAALREGPEATVRESADLLYHLMVLWAALGIRPEDVWNELERREGVSGVAEKAARKTEE